MKKVVLTEQDAPAAVLMKDPPECSVLESRRWLECHGMKRTGKKQDLIAKVRGCLPINKYLALKSIPEDDKI